MMIEQEYVKLVELVSNFDSNLITVKSWGVTLGLAAIGLGFKEKNWGYFLLAIVCGVSFWVIEFTIKGHQMRYFPRMREIEHEMWADSSPHSPRIDWSWKYADRILGGKVSPEKAEHKLSKRPPLMLSYYNWPWYRRMFLTHIMYPHIFSIVLGGVFAWLAYYRKGRFRDFGPKPPTPPQPPLLRRRRRRPPVQS
jgi:hypothetical protein